MAAVEARSMIRSAILLGALCLYAPVSNAAGRALDGHPVSIVKAQSWCIGPGENIPSWDFPAHPECKMTWRELAKAGGRVLYSARYAWPSSARGGQSSRVLTEVLFEGIPGSRVVRSLYAVQEDEARILLAPLAVHAIGDVTVLDARICMSGTTECGDEFAIWHDGRVETVKDHTIAEIRAGLPRGYDLNTNPRIDLASLSGRGAASTHGDADCCPSATLAFKLRLDGTELHVQDLEVRNTHTSR